MRRLFWLASVLGAVIGLQAQNPKPQSKDDLILDKLDQIIKILAEATEPDQALATHLKVDIKDAPVMGADDAPVTIVEFTDFQCPFCQKFHTDTFPRLRDEYISKGKVRFVSRDLPLSIHADAGKAAEAGRCAGEQGQFWEMRDWMQTNPTKLSIEDLRAHAIEMKLDLEQYRYCMATGQYREAVIASSEDAKNLHIGGTPTFVIGKTAAAIDGEVVVGAQPYDVFAGKLDALLK